MLTSSAMRKGPDNFKDLNDQTLNDLKILMIQWPRRPKSTKWLKWPKWT